MALFHTDSLVLCYGDVERARRWWIRTFACNQGDVPAEWDDPLPSDVALSLPGSPEPTILLCAQSEVRGAGYQRSNERPILFCRKATKAHEYLENQGAVPGPIQHSAGLAFFEVRDPEDNAIEICEEP